LAQQRYPQWRIVLVERFRNGDGATAHSAGVLLATGRTPRERQLAAFSARQYREVRHPLGLQTTSSDAFWVTDAPRVPALTQVAADFEIDVTPCPPDVLRDRLPAPLVLG